MKFILACILMFVGLYGFYMAFYIRPQLLPLYKDIPESSLGILNVMTLSGLIIYAFVSTFCVGLAIFLLRRKK